MKNYLAYFILIICFAGCNLPAKTNPEQDLNGNWRLYDVEQLHPSSNKPDNFTDVANLKKIVQEGESLNFFGDHTFTDCKGELIYVTGNWLYAETDKNFQLQDSSKNYSITISKIKHDASGHIFFEIMDTTKNRKCTFIKITNPLQEFRDDPFYAVNNIWRIKPAAREDTLQLRARLANYFRHLALILKAAKERKQDVVSFEFSLGPVKIYNGAIGMYDYKNVPFSWKKGYYDDADAKTAYYMYQDYLSAGSYKGVNIGNWIEDDYNILLSIYADFNNPSQ